MNKSLRSQDLWVDSLVFQALLYTNGELERDEAASFEQLLSEQQAAREAVARAVHLAQALNNELKTGPDRAYRQRVRELLRPRRSFWSWLTRHRGRFVCSGVGAVAAVLLVLVCVHWPLFPAGNRNPGAEATAELWPEEVAVAAGQPLPDTTAEEAQYFADLSSLGAFRKAHDELRMDNQRRRLPSSEEAVRWAGSSSLEKVREAHSKLGRTDERRNRPTQPMKQGIHR